jgi:hypothetical protein
METALIFHILIFMLLVVAGNQVLYNNAADGDHQSDMGKNVPLAGTCTNPFILTDWFFSEKN